MKVETKKFQPSVYVICLSAYQDKMQQANTNNRRDVWSIWQKPYGVWIDATMHPEDMWIEIEKMLIESPAINSTETWIIDSYEDMGDIFGVLEEFDDLEKLSEWGNAIAKHGEAYIAYLGLDPEGFESAFECEYRGCYSTPLEYAKQRYLEDHYVPEYVEIYIDWDLVSEDMFANNSYAPKGSHFLYVEGSQGFHIFEQVC